MQGMNDTPTVPSTVQAPQLIYARDVAELLGRSEASLRWMVHNGTAPPSASIGGRRMWKKQQVLAWIEAQFEETS